MVLLMASLHDDSSLVALLDKLDRSRVGSGPDGSVLGKVLGLSDLGIGYSAWCLGCKIRLGVEYSGFRA